MHSFPAVMMEMDDDETLTAYHEAGHAVIAYALGGTIESMQLGGEADEILPARFGECRVNWGPVAPAADWQRQREILTVLAGPAAEMIYRQQPLLWGQWHRDEHAASWADDLRRAGELAGTIYPAVSQTRRFLRLSMQSLEQHLTQEPCWAAVAAVADELLAHEFLEWEQLVEVLGFWDRWGGT